GFEDGTDRAPLRPGLRQGQQRHRSFHRPPAQETRSGWQLETHHHRSRPGLSPGAQAASAALMLRSLTGRFIFASVLLLPLLLLASAYMLDLAFRRSLLSGENERLRAHAYLLLGAAEFTEGRLWMPEEFEEARFNQIDSGLYGLIGDDQGAILWRSPSARLLRVQPPESTVIPGHTSF